LSPSPPDWTIDTNVLYKAASVDMNAVSFLMTIFKERHIVTFDTEGRIEREYRNCIEKTRIEGGNELVKKWFIEVVGKLAYKFSGRLSQRHQRSLRKLAFDRSDWPFVAVCSMALSKHLVSDDSDYHDNIKSYLKSSMHINVLSTQEAADL